MTTSTYETPNPPMGTLTIGGFCQAYNLGKTRAYEEIKAGRLRAVKVGTKTLIPRAAADDWLNSLPPLRP